MGGTVGLGPLVEVGRWAGLVGEPGDKWLVKGNVLARVIDRAAGPVPPAFFDIDAQAGAAGVSATDPTIGLQTNAVPVKLRVRKSKVPNSGVIIDSDSHVVMDGGTVIEVSVMAPTGWVQIPPLAPTAPPVEFGLYVNVAVTVCPCRCGLPAPGVLTWYASELADETLIIRPNRASRWQVWGPTPGGSVWRAHSDAQGSGIDVPMGEQQLDGTSTNTDLWAGAAAAFELVAGGGAPFRWVWSIE